MTDSLYTAAAHASAAAVIAHYSTSFGTSTRLLAPELRTPIRSIYALVRVADEVVDGSAAQAGLSLAEQRRQLDDLENETVRALDCGFSTNLIVHAFADVGRRYGISPSLTAPFFASMRRDLDSAPLADGELGSYIHGSAEVVGLMCLRVFVAGVSYSPEQHRVLEAGATRLGAAFQKVNFLRDLAADAGQLGRNYLPGVQGAALTETTKNALLDDIDDDLLAAEEAITLLPRGSRVAVATAARLFARLAEKLRRTPAERLMVTRVRVTDAAKLGIAARTALSSGGRRP
ncbi:squalene/phytoene synthase family protein [Rathayibacter sp. YIM 133350]|uniref:phytoene/squalene synthase family protein n=1 Tax=Rathayibacter sp. YIM 133350 TaxID=3131992 RepID=UPI00307DA5AD